MRLITLATLMALLGGGGLSAQEAVPLTFDWEPGLRGTLTQTLDQSSGAAGMQVRQRLVTRHVIETVAHPEGLLIRLRDGELIESSLPGGMEMPGADEFMSSVAASSYDLIVDAEGALIRIERDEATMESLRAALDEMMAPLRSMPGAEGMTSMFEEMLSEGALNAGAQQNWSSSVGLFTGDEMEFGETYSTREEAPFPMMQNRTLLMDMRASLAGRVPCVDGGAPEACVRVQVESTVDPEDVLQMMEEMFGRIFADAPMEMEMTMGAFEQTSLVDAVIDPTTLLPYTVTVTSTANIEVEVMGQSVPTAQEMELVMAYAWEGR